MSDQNHTPSSQAPDPKAEPKAEPKSKAPSKAKGWFARLKALDANEALSSHLGLDLRSLAAFRIAMALLVLSDVYHRALNLEAHYTDVGFMPRDRLLGGWSQPLFYSFHNWGGDKTSQFILFAIAAVFAAMLLVGFKTRLATILTFLMVASVQGRNYLILQGGDDLLRVMLFWGMFVPLGARFSIDAVLARADQPAPRVLPKRILTVASLVLAVQLLTMYFVSGVLKTGPTWHAQGNAIYLALHHHAFATPFGIWFRQLPIPLLQYMTWSVYYLELLGPLLFFVPYKNEWARTAQALIFMSFHFGLFLTMELGHFPWVAMGAWLMMFPSWFWDKPLKGLLQKVRLEPVIEQLSARLQGFIVRHRHWFCRRELRDLRIHPTKFGTILVSVLAVYTAYGTAYSATHRGDVEGKQFNPLLILRLYANWGMFAPNPPNTSGWFVIVGNQKNGLEVDVWNNVSPVSWEKPEVPSATYRAQRWRKFLDNITNERHAVVRPYFLKWVCRDWNERHEPDEQIRSATLYHLSQIATWPEPGYTEVSKKNLQRQSCPAVPIKKSK